MPFEAADGVPGGYVPQDQGGVPRAREGGRAIRGKRDAVDPVAMPLEAAQFGSAFQIPQNLLALTADAVGFQFATTAGEGQSRIGAEGGVLHGVAVAFQDSARPRPKGNG